MKQGKKPLAVWPPRGFSLCSCPDETPTGIDRLRRWHRYPVARHNLLLIREHFPASRIHQHLEPVYVVVSVRLVVTESLDTGKVLQPLPQSVQQWLVDPEVVGVAMHIGYRPLEGHDLVPQSQQKFLEAVGKSVRFGQGLRVPLRTSGAVRQVEARISLRDQHDRSRVASLGLGKSLLHPENVRLVTRSIFDRVREHVTEVVAGALNVERGVCHPTHRPAAVLHTRYLAARAEAQRIRLHLLPQLTLAQRGRSVEKERPLLIQLRE